MKRFESRLERLDDIERRLAQTPGGLTPGQLAYSLGVNRTTIHRDISALERRGTGLLKEGHRWRLDHRRSLYGAKFTPYELVALYIGARLLSRHSDEYNPYAVKALEKLADALRAHSPLVANHLHSAATTIGARPIKPAYVEAFEALTVGWIQQRKVRLSYVSAASAPDDPPTERLFSPYILEPVGIGFSCYAIGMDELRGEVRTLKLERIQHACVTDERFTIPNDFDASRKFADAWGIIWSNEGQEEEVRLRFSARVVRRVKESYWHPSQQIQELPDGSCVLVVRVGSILELKPWVRQWGADVEVLQPSQLRTEIAEEAHALAAMYVHP